MRVLFLGSPQEVVPILDSLRQDHEFNARHQIVGVVSQPARPTGRGGKLAHPPVADYARQAGLPLLQPESVKDPAFIEAMQALAPDIALTAAFGQILTKEFLAVPTRATINIHPSLLPRYRGAVPVPTTLLANDQETGVTVLFTVRKLDAGNLILQETFPISAEETSATLLNRLFRESAKLIVPALAKLEDPNYAGTPQDESLATHCRKIEKDDGNVDWSQPSDMIMNKFRAYEPWPGSFTFLGDRRLALVSMALGNAESSPQQVAPDITPSIPGQVFFDKRLKSLLVGTGNQGFIRVTAIRPAGGKTMDAAGFWNGLKNRDQISFTREAQP